MESWARALETEATALPFDLVRPSGLDFHDGPHLWSTPRPLRNPRADRCRWYGLPTPDQEKIF